MSLVRTTPFALAALALLGLAAARPAAAQTIINGSFEANTFAAFPGYANYTDTTTGISNGSITGWTSSGGAGLNPYTNPGAHSDSTGPNPFANNGRVPDGSQVAFLQGGGTTLTQTLTGLTSGNLYQISFYDNSRTNYAIPTLSLLVNNQPIFSQTISHVDSYQSFNAPYNFVTATFTASSASEALQFANTTASGVDATALIDNVQLRNLSASAAPEPSQIAGIGFAVLGLSGLLLKARKRNAATAAA